jgi:hypothetical protein
MKKLLAALLLSAATLLNAQSTEKKVLHIYVDQLHFASNPDLDGLLRSKLISSLAQECGIGCKVVEDFGPTESNGSDKADAVLTGGGVLESPDNVHRRLQGGMRLVDKDGTVLWADTIYSSPFARSISSSFADNTAKKVAAVLEARRKVIFLFACNNVC